MNAYLYNLIISLLKIAALFYLVFMLAPKLTFLKILVHEHTDKFFAGVLMMSSFFIILIHVLALLKLYDILSLAISFLLFIAAIVWFSQKKKSSSFLTDINHSVLRFIEGDPKKYFNKSREYENFIQEENSEKLDTIWKVMLSIVLGVTGVLRLLPVFQNAAPFSIESYQTLEYVKQLQLKVLFPDQAIVPKGLHALIDVFFQFTRANPNIIVHVFGALIAILMAFLIFHIVIKMTKNATAAIVGASVFGIFTRLLPLNIQQQVEANTVLLAVIFVFAGLVFMLDFFSNQDKKYLFFALTVFVAALLISLFSVAMILWTVLPMTLTFIHYLNYRKKLTAFRWLTILLPVVVFILLYFFFHTVSNNFYLSETIRNLIYDDAFNRFNKTALIFPEFYYLAAGVGIAFFFLWMSYANKPKTHFFKYNFFGYYLLTILFLWRADLFGLPDIFNKSQIGLILSVVLSFSLGIIVHFLFFRFLGKMLIGIRKNYTSQVVYGLIVFLIITELMIVFKAPEIAKFSYTTEPNGFVKSVYAIQKEYDAYQWTVVSHFGTRTQILNSGRYMDYLYFLNYYQPEKFNQVKDKKITTKYLFIFTEKSKTVSGIDSALLPHIEHLNEKLQNWCLAYQQYHKNIDVYFEDKQVRIYRIKIESEPKQFSGQI